MGLRYMLISTLAKPETRAELISRDGSAAVRSLWRDRDRVLTAASVFLFFAALGYTRGVLPLHVRSLQASDIAVGMVTAAGPAGELAMRWVSAPLLERYAPRVIMLYCSAALAFISLAYGFVPTVSLVVLLTLLHGASIGGFGTGAATQILVGTNSEESRTLALSAYALARMTAQIAAPAVGLTLATRISTSTVLVWAAVAGAAALVPLWAVRSHPSGSRESGGNVRELLKTVLRALQDRVLVGAVLAYTAWAFTMAGLGSFLPLFGRERGIMNVAFFFTTSGILNIIGTLLLGPLMSRFGRDRLLDASAVFIVSGIGLVLAAWTPMALVIAGVLFGLGTFSVYPCLAAVAVGRLPQSTGTAIVLFMTGMDIGMSLGSLVSGVIARGLGYSAVFVTGAVLSCLGLGAYRVFRASTGEKGVVLP